MAVFKSNVPPSELLRKGESSQAPGGGRQTKEEYRREKELEEDRKAGIAPAIADVETGRDINPHIPQFITQAPWYTAPKGPTLHHQRPHPEREKQMSNIIDWFQRGVTDKVATRYRKGSCENCGSITHKQKDCFERPRKVGARWTGDDIAPDEFLQPNLKLAWDAKRDRWNGYNPMEHKQVIEEYQKLEETRKMVKAEKIKESLDEKATEESVAEGDEDLEKDEDKYAEDADMPGVKTDMDSRTRITVRNLRIREDTAKYLYNLNENAPYYDPKSRSMRENPFLGVPGKEQEAAKFAGENFVRFTGEVLEANKAQIFAWQAKQRGVDVHALAEPTKLAALQKEFEVKKHSFKDEQKQSVLETYGGKEHLQSLPKEMMPSQTDTYREYSRKGNLLKGEEKPTVRSRYEEDIYPNNHTSVWGSYWKDGQWGYRCCLSFVRNSYCVGAVQQTTQPPSAASLPDKPPTEQQGKHGKNKEETDSSSGSSTSTSTSSSSSSEDEQQKEEEEEEEKEKKVSSRKRQLSKKKKKKKKERRRSSSSSSSSSSSEEELMTRKKKAKKGVAGPPPSSSELDLALKRAEQQEKEAESLLAMDERNRPYNSVYEVKAPTEAEMEAYKLRQILPSDPMAQFFGKKSKKDK